MQNANIFGLILSCVIFAGLLWIRRSKIITEHKNQAFLDMMMARTAIGVFVIGMYLLVDWLITETKIIRISFESSLITLAVLGAAYLIYRSRKDDISEVEKEKKRNKNRDKWERKHERLDK
jgi:Sec7-like guanine-nucleotide exchange factor